MDELELIKELDDRHQPHLIYQGEYRLKVLAKDIYSPFKSLFDDWQQRIYRFENDVGASVVLYNPLNKNTLTWDFVLAKFRGDDPFDFVYADGVTSGLEWREVQRRLDNIKPG